MHLHRDMKGKLKIKTKKRDQTEIDKGPSPDSICCGVSVYHMMDNFVEGGSFLRDVRLR